MSTEVLNTKALVRTFRKVYSRHELAEIIGTSPVSIVRWERGKFLASGRFAPGFDRAIRQFSQEFGGFPEVQEAIRDSLRVIIRQVRR